MEEVIHNILKSFNDIEKSINVISKNTKEFSNARQSLRPDLDILKRWAEEIKAQRQSIYVVGKTSTGKSTFHNFLLDLSDGQSLFKTSTKVETSVLQTLQHVDSWSDARVEIAIKNRNNFDLLKIPDKNIKNNLAILKLKTKSQKEILTDKIMVIDSVKGYKPEIALNRIDIFYPMRIFKNFTFIDTPGLASHRESTDETVRNHIKARSHIFWLLNASQATISDDTKLISKETSIVSDSEILKRIVFLGNLFDLLEIDGKREEKKKKWLKIQKKIRKKLEIVIKSISKDFKLKKIVLLFTSFKKPKKRLIDKTTDDIMRELEEMLLLDTGNRKYDNISSLVNTMIMVLQKMKTEILSKKQKEVILETEEFETQNKILNKNREEITTKSKAVQDDLRKIINNIERFDFQKKRGSDYQAVVQKIIVKIETLKNKIKNIHKNYAKDAMVSKKTKEYYRNIQKFTIPKKAQVDDSEIFKLLEIMWKKSFKDKKEILITSLKTLKSGFKNYKDSINNDFGRGKETFNSEQKTLDKRLEDNVKESDSLKESEERINELIIKTNNIYSELLNGINTKLKKWKKPLIPNEYKTLESFLELFHLTEEYSIIEKRGRENGK